MFDNKRLPYNGAVAPLFANLTNAESAGNLLDFVSNGVKIRSTDNDINASGVTYIYYAVAEYPLKFAPAR